MSEKTHYALRGVLLLGFSLLLAKLISSGEINYYLAPRLQPLTYVTLGILVILTGSCFYHVARGTKLLECECGESHSLPNRVWKNVIVYGLFVVPLAMAFLLPAKLLGTAVAEKKGVNLLKGDAKQQMAAAAVSMSHLASPQPTIPDNAEKSETSSVQSKKTSNDQELRKLFDPQFGEYYVDLGVSLYKQKIIQITDQNYLDVMTILELYPKIFAGKQVETMGFVFKGPELKANEFVAARFSVTCCTADASVTGILIRSDDAKKLAPDSWVKVKGTLKVSAVNGDEFLMMVATGKPTPVSPPKTPYVYYNYGTK